MQKLQVRTGQAALPQDTTEQSTTLTLATQKGVDLAFTSADRTLSLDDFSRRVLAPAINKLVGNIAADVMTGAEAGTANYVANTDSGGNILAPTVGTWLSAGAVLDMKSAPNLDRNLVLNPFTMAKTIPSMAGLLNPMPRISEQYEDADIKGGLNFMWFKDQTVINHTAGSYNSLGTVNGAGQSGTTVVVGAITGNLVIGDIVTFAGVNSVNRITSVDTGALAQFVITAPAANGATSVSVFPAIVPPAIVGGVTTPVQYQTVTAAPANGAVMAMVNPASTTYRKNLAFLPEAVILATADLELPEGVANAAREKYDDLTMRMISAYDIRDDVYFTRLDILYGYLWIRPDWVVAVADNISIS